MNDMKRKACAAGLLTLLVLLFSACKDTKTYAEQLAEMQESIEKFLDAHHSQVVGKQPATLPWIGADSSLLYYKTPSGLYIHVIDTGLSAGNVRKGQVALVRYTEMSVKGDSATYSNMSGNSQPVKICYGNVNTGQSNTYYWGDCQAWHEALQYVGDGGHVKIIAPNDLGMPIYNNSNYELLAHYYELKYTFWK